MWGEQTGHRSRLKNALNWMHKKPKNLNGMKKIILITIVLIWSIESYSQSSWDYVKNGSRKMDLMDYHGAILDFSKAIQLNPKESFAFMYRGYCKAELEDYRGAISDYSKAIQLVDPWKEDLLAEAYNARGSAKSLLKDSSGAILDLNKAIELGEDSGSAYYNRGLTRIEMNQKELGCLDLSKAGELGLSKAYTAIRAKCN